MKQPYLTQKGNKKLLMVQERPFLMLAGEVHNSNSSTTAAMEPVWKQAKELGMNTLLLPVSWEQLEPEEGVFEFALVDGLLAQAREAGMKLGFLWFGAWKNAQCLYAPAWVKTDLARFRRAQVVPGENNSRLMNFHGMQYTSLSYLCEETRLADARAFAALLEHLREVDGDEQTVVWMQVENETGVMGEARERSAEADQAFASAVPAEFAAYMKGHTASMVPDVRAAVEAGAEAGSWSEVFGACAEEIFSAYHIASYVNFVAAEGRRAYNLPCSANCWLDKGAKPGVYPSGGPVRRMLEVWQCCAPEIDVLSPDIYVPNFMEICDSYAQEGNPLLIPETAVHSYCGPRLVYSIGHYHALCYSPFGFEDMGQPFSGTMDFLFGMDVTDPALKTPQNPEEYGWYGRTLQSMLPLLTERYGTDDLQAVSSESGTDTMLFGSFGFKAVMDERIKSMYGNRTDGVCLALKAAEDTFYVLCCGCMLAPFSANPEKPAVDFLDFEEGYFEDGRWVVTRRRNGDEAQMTGVARPSLFRLRLFAYR